MKHLSLVLSTLEIIILNNNNDDDEFLGKKKLKVEKYYGVPKHFIMTAVAPTPHIIE